MARKKRNKRKLGDAVESVTKATGIKSLVEFFNDGKPCGGCEKRKERLNRMSLFKKTKVFRTFTEDEYNRYKDFKENRTLKIDFKTIIYLCKLYSDVFNLPYWQPTCFACQGTIKSVGAIIDKLDKVFDSYN